MKTLLVSLAALLASAFTPALAQSPCSAEVPIVHYTPRFLCPGQADTLRAGRFDSYQWLQDGQPLPGETGPNLAIHPEQGGHRISLVATAWGCEDTSASIRLEGGLALAATGSFTADSTGRLLACEATAFMPQDSVGLIATAGYPAQRRWFHNGLAIQDAQSLSLRVTEAGIYELQISPDACPNFVQRQILTVETTTPVQAAVSMHLGQLVAEGPAGTEFRTYAWMRDGQLILGATESAYTPTQPGSYVVRTDDGTCYGFSEAYMYAAPLATIR